MGVEPSLSGVYFKFERFGANACGDCARFTCRLPLPSTTYAGGRGCVCGCKLVTNYVQHKLRRWLWLWPGQGFPSFYSFRCVRRFKQPHPATPTVTCPFWATAAAATNQRKRKWQWKWKCSTTEQMMRNRRQLSKRCENLSQKMMKNRKMLTLLAHTHTDISLHTHTQTSDTHITFGADFCIWSVEQLPPKSRSAILFFSSFAGIKTLRMIKQKEWMD